MLREYLEKLSNLDGISGYEDEVREYIASCAAPYASEMITDKLGSLLVFVKGKEAPARPILVAAHMDEVGFMACRIGSDGLIGFRTSGGIDPRVMIGRRLRGGPEGIKGVISLKAVHLTTREERNHAVPTEKLSFDIGASSAEEAKKYINIGDQICFDEEFSDFGDGFWAGKAFDDRIGCAIALEMMRSPLPYDTWFAFTHGEEIGLRGAGPVGRRIDPGLCIVLEGSPVADITDIPLHKYAEKVGEGPSLWMMDAGTIYCRDLNRRLKAEAEARGIKCQYHLSSSGATDGGAIHKGASGARAICISPPVRYVHAARGIVKASDAEDAVKLANLALEIGGKEYV